MRYVNWIALSLALTGALVGCAVDDSVAPTNTINTGSGGKAASGSSGRTVGSGGSVTSGRPDTVSTLGAGGSAGAETGAGGLAGTAGSADASSGGAGGGSAAGGGGRDGAAGGQDAARESGLDARASEGNPPDARMPDAGQDVADVSCAPETDANFCGRYQRNCGAFIAIDSCGVSRTTSCGICALDAANCGRGGTLNVCLGGGPINRARGGNITSSNMADSTGEDMTKAFDNSVTTKWLALGTPTPWITYQFPGGQTFAITSYTVTSANDFADRDPKDWRFEGSNDGVNWTTLDTRTSEIFVSRFQTNRYSFTNTTSYPVYQFKVMASNGSADFQVAEIQFFGNPGPVLEAGAPADGAAADTGADAANQ